MAEPDSPQGESSPCEWCSRPGRVLNWSVRLLGGRVFRSPALCTTCEHLISFYPGGLREDDEFLAAQDRMYAELADNYERDQAEVAAIVVWFAARGVTMTVAPGIECVWADLDLPNGEGEHYVSGAKDIFVARAAKARYEAAR